MENDLPCDKIKMRISAYFDNELPETESKIVETHIAKCNECSNDYDNLKNISISLKNSGKKLYLRRSKIAYKVISRLDNEKELTCNEVLKELSAYYDGELTLNLHYLISNHLRNCATCQSEYENLKKISFMIKSAYSEKINLQV